MTKGAFRGFQLFVLILIMICVTLGAWQIQRHFWKAELLEQAKLASEQPSVPLPSDLGDVDAYRRFSIRGSFIEGRDIAIFGYALEGISGSRMYAPFRLEDGRVILVHRGWVRRGNEDLFARDTGTTLEMEIAFRPVRPPRGGPSFLQLQNVPEIGLWTYINTTELEAYWTDLDLIDRAFGELRAPLAAGQGSRIEPFRADLFNKHLEYVATWWSLAAGFFGIYIMVWLDRRRKLK